MTTDRMTMSLSGSKIARCEAVAAANSRLPNLKKATPLQIGGIEIDRRNKRVRRSGREFRLSPVEFRLFDLLMSNPGRAFSRDDLVSTIWPGPNIDVRTVDVTVGRLRKAINRGWLPDPIRSVRGRGYKFSEDFEQQYREWLAGGKKKIRLKASVGT